MSTREMAQSIFDRLSEKELEGFIAMYSGVFAVRGNAAAHTQAEREAAFAELEQIRNNIKPVREDFDEKKEYLSYLDERYGT